MEHVKTEMLKQVQYGIAGAGVILNLFQGPGKVWDRPAPVHARRTDSVRASSLSMYIPLNPPSKGDLKTIPGAPVPSCQ